jgi:dienelactone hydrolase
MARFPRGMLPACLVLALAHATRADDPRPMRATPAMLRAPRTFPAPGLQAEGVEALFYEGMPWKGEPTRVFAWVGLPKVEPGKTVPGIVLVHGGGGTAFASWVRLWVGRGYAAIAMDTCGTVPRGTYGKWERHPDGGPPGNRFDASAAPAEDQWPYHAVADAILAHSLLREHRGVDPDRIGVTGISWGGYLTCLVSGLDDRLKFAVPVYGCGFLGEDSVWADEIRRLGEPGRRWLALWDPAHYLPAGKMPRLWVTGTNDFAYPMDSLRKSYEVAGGTSTLCVRVRMPHGHGPVGENPEEIRAFADSIVKGGPPLARFTGQSLDGVIVSATFKPSVPVVKAELIYTKDRGPWTVRKWEAVAATLGGDTAKAMLPAGTAAYYMNIEDERGCVVSTRHETIPAPSRVSRPRPGPGDGRGDACSSPDTES